MQCRTCLRVALFCLACGLIGLPAFGGLRFASKERAVLQDPSIIQPVRPTHVLPGSANGRSDSAIHAAANLANLDTAQWIEVPIHRTCRPMGHPQISNHSVRTLPRCLTV